VSEAAAVCVFCGSSPGTNPAFAQASRRLGQGLARRGIGLVYGGASVGLMGLVADAAIAAGGTATGVITEALAGHEIAHTQLDRLHVVTTMHERKALMSELSDAFVMAPGGFGTYEEFLEAVTWAQLGLHDKRCGVFNVEGYFDDLLAFFAHVSTMASSAGDSSRRWSSRTTSTRSSAVFWAPSCRTGRTVRTERRGSRARSELATSA
jgi:uncharacterized protein (TIGR00730 family)